MNSNKPIVVFGGTGNYGSCIVTKLIEKKQRIRVISRKEENARKLFGNDVEVVEGDVTSKDTILQSLKNADAIIICLSAVTIKLIRRLKEIERDAVFRIMEEAQKAGINRLVYLSVYDLRIDLLQNLNILPLGEVKIEVEKRIRESGLNWTILGCPPIYDLFFAFLRNQKMSVPGGGKKPIACVSGNDVGEIAAQAVMRNDLAGQRLRMTGPEALSFPEVASRIGKATGQAVKHISIPLTAVNIVSFLTKPFNPFIRYIYYSLKMMNNFPDDLSENVPKDHRLLHELFDYHSRTIDEEIEERIRDRKI